MRQDERGYIVIETIGAFMLFFLLMFSILTLVNIVALQARVHYALTQAANTLSMYSYVAEVTGMSDIMMNLDREAEEVRENAEEFKSNINSVLSGMKSFDLGEVRYNGEQALERASNWGRDTLDDPVETIRLVLDYGLNEVRGALTEELIRPLIGKYLGNGMLSGDQYLTSMNVIGGLRGLDFYDFSLFDFTSPGDNDTKLLDRNGNIKIIVRYDVSYSFGALQLPFPKLSITQGVKTKAWLSGSGEEG